MTLTPGERKFLHRWRTGPGRDPAVVVRRRRQGQAVDPRLDALFKALPLESQRRVCGLVVAETEAVMAPHVARSGVPFRSPALEILRAMAAGRPPAAADLAALTAPRED
jgi:hypothetical protein